MFAGQVGSPWRPIAALVFLFIGLGAGLVPLIGLRDTGMELMLVTPVSFAVVTLTSVALFYGRIWSPDRELGVLLGLCLVGFVLQFRGFLFTRKRAR
jgi:hypothetical protein